jgi:hypothetical protein
MILHVDNQPAIAAANGGGSFEKLKHIRIRHYQLEEAVTEKLIRLQYVPTQDNVADIYTKALPGPRFNELSKKIMGHV